VMPVRNEDVVSQGDGPSSAGAKNQSTDVAWDASATWPVEANPRAVNRAGN
jgi:hypothetical protein